MLKSVKRLHSLTHTQYTSCHLLHHTLLLTADMLWRSGLCSLSLSPPLAASHLLLET